MLGRALAQEALDGAEAGIRSGDRRRREQDEATGVAFAEGHGSARIATTGLPYEQDYVMVIEAKDGKIIRYREYWNPLPAIEAFGGQEALAALGRSS